MVDLAFLSADEVSRLFLMRTAKIEFKLLFLLIIFIFLNDPSCLFKIQI